MPSFLSYTRLSIRAQRLHFLSPILSTVHAAPFTIPPNARSQPHSAAPFVQRPTFTMGLRFHSNANTSAQDSCGYSHSKEELKQKVDDFVAAENSKLGATLEGSDPELADVLMRNKEWVVRKSKDDPDFFPALGRGQTPRYLYIGCSDARVDPAQMMGVSYGDLFVHRNVGNIVSGTDLNFLSVLEFAVDVLKVPQIIVCGHYDCGAVRGSIAQPKSGGLGLIENWIRNIRDVARIHKDELLAIKDTEQRQRRLVELNVMEQCFNVFKSACVQRRRVQTYVHDRRYTLPRVHGLVFDVSDGILKKLPLNFKQELSDLREIYQLYEVPAWAKSEDSHEHEYWEGSIPKAK